MRSSGVSNSCPISSELTVQDDRTLVNTSVAFCSWGVSDPPVQDPKDLGLALRELREQTGHSLDTVAHRGYTEDARLTGSQVAQIERGEKRPRHSTLLAILRGVGLPPGEWPEPIRLAVISGELNAHQVGFEHAAATLKMLAAGDVDAALQAALHDPADALAQALEDAAPAHDGQQRARGRKRAASQATPRAAAPNGRARKKAQ